LVQSIETGELFYINGGKRLHVGSFVQGQRFNFVQPKRVYAYQLADFPLGQFATPVDGTMVKRVGDPTVYWIANGLKLPITYPVFVQRGLRFDRVITLDEQEISSWLVGKALPPVDGSLVRGTAGKTVYWVVGGVLHPISNSFYKNRGLSVFPIVYMNDAEVKLFPRGEPYL
jgi:hypothetical protein